jgi:hypothetical protein
MARRDPRERQRDDEDQQPNSGNRKGTEGADWV